MLEFITDTTRVPRSDAVAMHKVRDLTDLCIRKTSGNPFFTDNPLPPLGPVQPATTTDGFADDFSWGYRMLLRAEYLGAVGAVNLSPQIAFAHDVDGTTPQPLGNFVEGRKAVTLSLAASYLNSLQALVSYTNFFGGGDFNLMKDRDFVSISVSYFF